MDRSLSILLVEDDDADRMLVQRALRNAFQIEALSCVTSLTEARDALDAASFDCLLLDYHLPDGTAVELLDELADQRAQIPPVVILTGLCDELTAIAALEKGAQDYLAKDGLNRQILLRAIRYAVERARSERALHHAEAQLLQAQKMEAIGRLAGGVAHDFNNLLTTISTFTAFVRETLQPGDPCYEDLGQVLQAAESAGRLTGQLLAFARRRQVDPQVVDVNEALLVVGKMLVRTLGTSVELVVLPHDQPLYVRIDSSQLDQLLFNLAVNAKDAMAGVGTLTIKLDRARQLSPGNTDANDCARLTVSDTGCGMSPEVLERLFEPFFSSKGEAGTGLGLSICYGVVNQAGGTIDVASERGRGSRFTVLLPLTDTVPDADRPVRDPNWARLPDEVRVLVVEDQAAILEIVSRTLEGQGLTVLRARSVEEALSMELGALNLLVSDVMLPGRSGVELAERLRKRQAGLPVLFISGYLGDHEIPLTNGANCTPMATTLFLAKPFSAATLLRKVFDALTLDLPAQQAEVSTSTEKQPAEGNRRGGQANGRPVNDRVVSSRASADAAQAGLAPAAAPDTTKAPSDGLVWVIDDDAAIRRILQRLLSNYYSVETLCCGNDAIERLAQDSAVDVLVCDLNMPQGSGIDLYNWLGANRPALLNRVLFLSGGDMSGSLRDVLGDQTDQMVSKPINMDLLMKRIRSMIAPIQGGHSSFAKEVPR